MLWMLLWESVSKFMDEIIRNEVRFTGKRE